MPELIEISRTMPASAASIWAVVTDLHRLGEWLPIKADLQFPNGMLSAPGVTVHIERDTPLGRIKLEQVFDRCDQPRLLTWKNCNETLGGKPVTQIKDFSTEMTLEELPPAAEAPQTRVTVRSRWTSVGMMGMVANNLMKPRMKHEYDVALQNIERLAKL